ncbi:glycine dehydrogenase [Clostridium carboxidivorans P7]|uniref:Probable glycine dehydrogenase (decarboxylating) subunit 1 n=1 Tax=Clostridium carboxidivorans P7 TaxID=536227 RepID=C6PSC2_9CLOT|nr:aminomethyl-transferring glycine dehydrogenase subunit GcvPA [Clostridium carboxidivorans]AKN33373.1 glycine dehydrogenase [Clostridium carboxidivorans P7]EET87919.1 Glycine dehydrogenase (decarboxylating) [Clostridium carboxidivorans P7]EFG89251.1 glycine dehydrogenase (decarboxylating) [Clostridium carboxidivorans P7]
MFPYIPVTPEDEKKMLDSIGLNSLDDLFSDIPESIKLKRSLNLPEGLSELELSKYLDTLANKNLSTSELTCFLGAGAYDHYIPALIKHIVSKSEFYTAYTPYQAEISQGTLQCIFEYQSMICELTGLDAANASMYDGATACTEAALMAVDSTRKRKILVSKTVHPETRKVLETYTKFKDIELVEIGIADGVTDLEKLTSAIDNKTAGVILQNPNFFGIIEDVKEVEKVTHDNKALLIMSVDPISLGILKSPGELGADIAVGEGQSLGNNMSFGGPYVGFMATKAKLMRKMPGRIVGQTQDLDGKRGFVLTLQAREQHIRREKATSNICSNEALNALTAAIYLTTMGKKGIKEVAYQSTQKAHYAFNKITKSGKFKPLFNKPFFKEFAVVSEKEPAIINDELLKNKILGGYPLGKNYAPYKNALLFCVTEKRTAQEIDKLVSVMEGV